MRDVGCGPDVRDHDWAAGMVNVHPEDLQALIDAGRHLECTQCDAEINADE
jgi:hypothetical protein